MAIEKYSAKTDVVVKLVLVFFISLLSFSIGTFVGKKFSDNQYRLAQLEPNAQSEGRGIASIPEDAMEVKPSDTLTDEEIAKLAEEFVNDDEESVMDTHHEKPSAPTDVAESSAKGSGHEAQPKAEKKVEAPTHGSSAHSSSAHSPSAVKHSAEASPAAQALAAGKAPTPVEKKVEAQQRIPSSLPRQIASSPAGKYTVQVAAYAEEKEAQVMSANLKEKGYSAFYVPAEVKGKKMYRVGVGLFNTANDADTYRKQLISKSVVSSAFIQKISSE